VVFLIVIVGRNFVLMEVKSNLLLLERKEPPFSKLHVITCGEGEGLHIFSAFLCYFIVDSAKFCSYNSGASLQNECLKIESD
jgi:hypothetical protein